MNHGMTETRIYQTWCNMKSRCYNKNNNRYKNYGERGIIVCEQWKHDFLCFYNWAIKNGYRDDLKIDRINNDGIYEPNNCKWSNDIEQANNRTTSRIITINGESHTINEWARIKNINRCIIKDRIIKLGWTDEDAVMVKKMDKWDHRKGVMNNK